MGLRMNDAATEADAPRVLNTHGMLAAELAHVRGIPEPSPDTVYDDALCLRLSALCLSGGGIRSAAFCLGVLQSLAGKGLLQKFDYLSTVSGGGFIGGWVQQLIRETSRSSQTEQGGSGACCVGRADPCLARATSTGQTARQHELPHAQDRSRLRRYLGRDRALHPQPDAELDCVRAGVPAGGTGTDSTPDADLVGRHQHCAQRGFDDRPSPRGNAAARLRRLSGMPLAAKSSIPRSARRKREQGEVSLGDQGHRGIGTRLGHAGADVAAKRARGPGVALCWCGTSLA